MSYRIGSQLQMQGLVIKPAPGYWKCYVSAYGLYSEIEQDGKRFSGFKLVYPVSETEYTGYITGETKTDLIQYRWMDQVDFARAFTLIIGEGMDWETRIAIPGIKEESSYDQVTGAMFVTGVKSEGRLYDAHLQYDGQGKFEIVSIEQTSP